VTFRNWANLRQKYKGVPLTIAMRLVYTAQAISIRGRNKNQLKKFGGAFFDGLDFQ